MEIICILIIGIIILIHIIAYFKYKSKTLLEEYLIMTNNYDYFLKEVMIYHKIKDEKIGKHMIKKLNQYNYPFRNAFELDGSEKGFEYWNELQDKYFSFSNIINKHE